MSSELKKCLKQFDKINIISTKKKKYEIFFMRKFDTTGQLFFIDRHFSNKKLLVP